jgi:FkbM family methyltransferase
MVRGGWHRVLLAPLRLAPATLAAEALSRAWDAAEVRISTGRNTVTFFAPTPILRMRAETALSKEPETIEWLDGIGADDVLWDIGANIGLFSLYAAAERACRVLAFEPSAGNYMVLTRNVQINGLDDRISAYALALSGETCLGVLNLDSSALGTAMNEFGRAGATSPYSSNPHPQGHGMIGITVDEFASRFAPPLPTHIKLDVDGLEWPILQGAVATLKSPRLKSIIVELSITNRAERERSIALLGSCGLHLRLQAGPQGETAEQGANHLFVRA